MHEFRKKLKAEGKEKKKKLQKNSGLQLSNHSPE